MSDAVALPHPKRITAVQAIVLGGLLSGVFDAIDGVIAYGLAQRWNPIQVLQYIASGLMGQSAFRGGLATAALGAVLHFFIAFCVSAIYVNAARRFPVLYQRTELFGLAYGAAVYLVMNFIVLPASAVVPLPPSLFLTINGIIGHALLVGLPIAVCARRTV